MGMSASEKRLERACNKLRAHDLAETANALRKVPSLLANHTPTTREHRIAVAAEEAERILAWAKQQKASKAA